jgi:hypothetical protein
VLSFVKLKQGRLFKSECWLKVAHVSAARVKGICGFIQAMMMTAGLLWSGCK